MVMVHVGRKVPKGFVELEGSIHLGGGLWAFRIVAKCPNCGRPLFDGETTIIDSLGRECHSGC